MQALICISAMFYLRMHVWSVHAMMPDVPDDCLFLIAIAGPCTRGIRLYSDMLHAPSHRSTDLPMHTCTYMGGTPGQTKPCTPTHSSHPCRMHPSALHYHVRTQPIRLPFPKSMTKSNQRIINPCSSLYHAPSGGDTKAPTCAPFGSTLQQAKHDGRVVTLHK